ncbi:hypothetical protein ACSBR2_035209 [Camellia fascicularis]
MKKKQQHEEEEEEQSKVRITKYPQTDLVVAAASLHLASVALLQESRRPAASRHRLCSSLTASPPLASPPPLLTSHRLRRLATETTPPAPQQPFEQLFEALEPFSCCIIADKHIGWVGDTGHKFQIPRIFFDGMSCLTLLCSHNLRISKFHDNISESEPFELPDLPDRIELTKAQLSILFTLGTPEWEAFQERVRVAEVESYGVVKGDKVWCIGPLSLCYKDNLDKAQRGNKATIDESQCLKWLNEQDPGSVVYACLGSISGLSLCQLIEIGLGLEASQHPFVWKWVEEDGFEERTKGKGLVIQGWAPQVLILSHRAVRAFLTHGGWNSTLEGVCTGVPMITWQMFSEQFLNEKLVVQVSEIGVSIGVQAVGHLIAEENCGELVERGN